MVLPGEKPILHIDVAHSSIKHALRIVGSATAVIPPHQTPFIICGFSSVMVVDDWFGIVHTIPPRSRDSRHQFRFIPAVERSSSKPGIEATDLGKSGPPIGDVGTLNNTGSNKTTCRKRKRLQRFLYCYSAVRWIVQQNPPSHKPKFWIFGEALEY